MKKLFMFIAVVTLAIVGSAAQLDWRYDATAADVGQTVYVLIGATATQDWESVDALSSAAAGSGAVAKSGRSSYLATGMLKTDDISKESANIYYVIVAADGASYSVTSVSDMSGMVYYPNNQESSPGSDQSLGPANITVSGKSFGGNPPPGPTPVDTPEPTSGLLLLVGGAALALRRKQK